MRNATLVDNVRRIARAQNTSLTKIEVALGFGNGTIGKWANAAKSPPYAKIKLIADYLGVTVAELTGEDTKKSPSVDEDERIKALLDSLSPEKRKVVKMALNLSDSAVKELLAEIELIFKE